MNTHLKWMTNKDLLYSTWNSVQRYVAAWMGGDWRRMDTCVCMDESLLCSPETIILICYIPIQGFPGGSVVKNLPANVGDMGLISGSGRSPGGGNGNLLQYFFARKFHKQKSLAGTVHEVGKSWV